MPKIDIRHLNLEDLPQPKTEKIIKRKNKEEFEKETTKKSKLKK